MESSTSSLGVCTLSSFNFVFPISVRVKTLKQIHLKILLVDTIGAAKVYQVDSEFVSVVFSSVYFFVHV